MRKHYDIIIVGAGSAALSFLNFLKDHFNVAVFEEQSNVGLRRHCTGIVSHRVLSIVGKAARRSVVNEFNRLNIMVESGAKVTVIPSNSIYVLDRVKYLRELFYRVQNKFEFYFASKVTNVRFSGKKIKPCVLLGNRTICGNIVVNAEGAVHRIRKRIFKNSITRKAKVYGIQMDCIGKTPHIDEFTVVFSDKYSKGFFGWIVPLDKSHVRIGIGGENADQNVLNSFIDFVDSKGIVHVKEKGKPFGGIILKNPPYWKDHYKKVVMLGDSAFHVKPLTGGGLYVHALFGRELANLINMELSDVENLLSKYKRRTARLRLKLKIQGVISQVFHELSLKEKEKIIKSIGENVEMKDVDYDYHEKLLETILLRKTSLAYNVLRTALTMRNIKNFVYSLKIFLQ